MVEFLRRHRVLLASGSLLLLSLLLVSTSKQFPGQQDPVGRFLLDGLAPLQAGITWLRLSVYRVWVGYLNLVDTRVENEQLHAQIATLEQDLVRLQELEQANQRLEALLDFGARLDLRVYGARVIGRDPLPWSQTLTIDRGERDGIRRGMAVLSPQGLVGQVIEVGHMAGRVLLLTDHNSGIDAIVQRSRARGILQGALEEGCQLKYVRRGEDVTVGDRVFTSGLDGIFPKGIMIGEVVDVSRLHRGLLQVAQVQPSAPLDRLEEVLIVEAGKPLQDEGP